MAEYRDRRKEEERVKAVRNDRGALMNERSRRVQIERKKKLRKKKQRRRVLVSATGGGFNSDGVSHCILLE